MTFTLYLVDESLMPSEDAEGTPAATPAAIIAAVLERGGRWSTIRTDVDQFADAIQTLDAFAGGRGFLSDLAFAGSPHYLLAGYPGQWRLGYFPASLVHHLHGAFQLQAPEMDEVLHEKPDVIRRACRTLLLALADASERGFALAVAHDG